MPTLNLVREEFDHMKWNEDILNRPSKPAPKSNKRKQPVPLLPSNDEAQERYCLFI